MKRVLSSLILVLASSLAFALPTPKDIKSSVDAGNYSQAESQLREVIKEKPGSAKAHYELGQVLAREGRAEDARQELLDAQRLEPSLKFAADPKHFTDLLGKLPSGSANRPGQAAPLVVQQAAPAAGFPWGYVLAGGGILLLVWFMMRRVVASGPSPLAPRPAGAAMAGGAAYGGPGYGQPYGQPYGGPVQGGGSGVGGAVLGGLAGMAAGYGLAKVLEHGEEGTARSQSASPSVANDNGYIPIDSGSNSDYGAFDAGSGSSDSWDDGGSSSDSDDSW